MQEEARRSWLAIGAMAIATLSIILNLVVISRLREAESMLTPVLPYLEEMVSTDGVLRSEVRIPSGTPINLDIPIDEQFSVSVDTILPINTRITVPLRSALGNYDIPVPIRANVPIRAVLPIRVRHVFQLRSSTPEDLVIPIEVGE
jgi:hypothetical protein